MPAFTPQPHQRTFVSIHFSSRVGYEAELAWVAPWNTEVLCPPEDGHPSKH